MLCRNYAIFIWIFFYQKPAYCQRGTCCPKHCGPSFIAIAYSNNYLRDKMFDLVCFARWLPSGDHNIHIGLRYLAYSTRCDCNMEIGWSLIVTQGYLRFSFDTIWKPIWVVISLKRKALGPHVINGIADIKEKARQHPSSFAFHHNLILMESARHNAVQWMNAIQIQKAYFTALYNNIHIYSRSFTS